MNKNNKKLTANDWLEAALNVLASDGVSAVAVEPLAKKLGVTKGSFYWHFKNREDLITNVIVYWESIETQYINHYRSYYSKPEEFMKESLSILINDDLNKSVLIAIAEDKSFSASRIAYQKAVHRRLNIWTAAYTSMGIEKAAAEVKAYETFCSYFGLIKLLLDQPVKINKTKQRSLIKGVISSAINLTT